MKIMYSYIMKLILRNIFISSLLIFMILFLSSAYGALGTMEGYDYNTINFLNLSIYSLILDVNKVIPMIAALSVILTILILMRSNELLAYMTIGGSIVNLVIPFLLIGIVVSSAMIIIEYKVVPDARIKKEYWRNVSKNRSPSMSTTGFNDTWFVGHDNVITNIGFVSITDKKVYNVTEYFMEERKIRSIVEIELISKQGNNWVADNITVSRLSTNPPKVEHIESKVLKEGTSIWDQMVSLSTTNEKALTPKELITMIELSKAKGVSSAQYELSLYSKLASALSVIVLVLFLFPISIDFSRNYSIVKNTAISFTFALIFIVSQVIFKTLGESGVFTPFHAAFGPIILFLIISILLIMKRSRAK